MICNSWKYFCSEEPDLIENYDAAISDPDRTWHLHHRAEVLPCGRFSVKDLKQFNLYYSRPASELIFLSPAEHTSLHKKGVSLSDEARRHFSDGKKGCSYWFNNGEKQVRAKECPTGFVNGRLNNRGTHWFNNGEKEIYSEDCPTGWLPGRLPVKESTREKHRVNNRLHPPFKGRKHTEEARKKISQKAKGRQSPWRGKHITQKMKDAISSARSKPVQQFDLEGHFIAEFPSITTAAKLTGFGGICKCCRGKQKQAGGYVWKYLTTTCL